MFSSDVPYGYRVLAVLAFLAVASLVELRLRGKRAERWRASLILITAGAGSGWRV